MAAKPVVIPFASTKAPRVEPRPPEDPSIAAAQRSLSEMLLHTAPMSHEYTDVRDRRRVPGAPLPLGAQLKATSALRPARSRLGPVAEILFGGSGAPLLSTTAGSAVFGRTQPADQLGSTLDAFAPLPEDPATGEPAVDAEVQRLTRRLEATGQLESSTKVRCPLAPSHAHSKVPRAPLPVAAQKVRSPVGTVKRLLENDVPPVLKSSYADELGHTAEVSVLRRKSAPDGRSYRPHPVARFFRSKRFSSPATRRTRFPSMTSADTRKPGAGLSRPVGRAAL